MQYKFKRFLYVNIFLINWFFMKIYHKNSPSYELGLPFYNITPTIIADKILTNVAPYTRRKPNDDTTFD